MATLRQLSSAGCSCSRPLLAPKRHVALGAARGRVHSATRAAIPERLPERGGDKAQDPLLEGAAFCPVPREQQPVHELSMLQETFLFDWATTSTPQFIQRLLTAWVGFMVTLGLPVAAVTFSLAREPVQCLVSASAGSMLIVIVLVLRLYLGYTHVGSRLLSATVEYEETGWYDGQIWVKTPQVLMRDRLLGMYTVKPALERLKRTLLGLGGGLAASVVLLSLLPPESVYSAPQAYNSSSSNSISRSNSNVVQTAGEGYEERLQRYEPWALEEDEEGEAGEGRGLSAHMRQ